MANFVFHQNRNGNPTIPSAKTTIPSAKTTGREAINVIFDSLVFINPLLTPVKIKRKFFLESPMETIKVVSNATGRETSQ